MCKGKDKDEKKKSSGSFFRVLSAVLLGLLFLLLSEDKNKKD